MQVGATNPGACKATRNLRRCAGQERTCSGSGEVKSAAAALCLPCHECDLVIATPARAPCIVPESRPDVLIERFIGTPRFAAAVDFAVPVDLRSVRLAAVAFGRFTPSGNGRASRLGRRRRFTSADAVSGVPTASYCVDSAAMSGAAS
eukprot:699619-Prymnesium_polylepis.1